MVGARGRAGTIYILAAIFGLLLVSGYLTRHTLSALLTSLALAYLLNPLLNFLEKRGLKRITAIVLLYGIGSALLIIVSLLLIPHIGQQAELLTDEMPRYAQNVKTAMDKWKIMLAPYYSGEEGAWLIARAEGFLTTLSGAVTGMGFARLKGALFGLFNLALAPILVFFMLLYKDFFKKSLIRLIPAPDREYLTGLGEKINSALERFIVAMLLDCMLVGMLCFAALWMLDIKFPLLNGLFAGFVSVVPVLGGLVAVIPPVFLGYAESGDLTIIPKVCALFFLIFIIIEGNLIKPLIMKSTLRLNPLAVIFSVMAMGELLGFWGIILAVPLAAVVKICAREIHHLYFDEGAP
jgi:predicted PurR-regulated permease PerM